MYLRLDDTRAQIEDGGDPAGQAPELTPSVPQPACCLDDRVQRLLVGLGLDEDHLRSAGADRFAADDKLHGCVANFPFRIGSMAYADESVTVPARQLDGTAIGWRQRLDDAVSAAFGLHRQWHQNTIGCEA